MPSKNITIQGLMQGVGFRPWLVRLAKKHLLQGVVFNDSQGVQITVQGLKNAITAFYAELTGPDNPGEIENITTEEIAETKYTDFSILASQQYEDGIFPVIPDRTICRTCLQELFDINNRRFNYPFITCASCGPRFSILHALPFDRENTSMVAFPMCTQCSTEYSSIDDRRYHAQTTSCSGCGPKLYFYDAKNNEHPEPLAAAIAELKAGGIIALKGIGGFNLVCDASNDTAVQNLRALKKRNTKPFAIMLRNLSEASQYCHLNTLEQQCLTSSQAPIVLAKKKACKKLSVNISAGLDEQGIFLPMTGLHHLIIKAVKKPLVVTSANITGFPIAFTDKNVRQQFSGLVDGILTNNRSIQFPCDDSVVRVMADFVTVIRRARGYSIMFKEKLPSANSLIALGAQMKNTIALQKKNRLYLSPYLGDLDSIEQIQRFNYYLSNLSKLLHVHDVKYVGDKHPGYNNIIEFTNKNIPVLPVQHHEAHAYASLFASPNANAVAIFAWDGTGLGDDGNIWGGETFVYRNKNLERTASLKAFKLIGIERAIKEPRRIALALLWDIYPEQLPQYWQQWSEQNFSTTEIQIFHKLWQSGKQTVTTTSMGRLFDGIAALLSITQINDFDGHAPMFLEACASTGKKMHTAALNIVKKHNLYEIDWSEWLANLARKLMLNDCEDIAYDFHATLAATIIKLTHTLACTKLILTGGVAQNKLLVELVNELSKQNKMELLHTAAVPPNDSGLAVGQIYAINERE